MNIFVIYEASFDNYIANMHLHFCLSFLLLLLWVLFSWLLHHYIDPTMNSVNEQNPSNTGMVVFLHRKGGVVLLVLCCWCCKVEIYISSPQTEVRYWQTRGRNITSNWKLLIGGRLYNFLFKLSFNFFHLLL